MRILVAATVPADETQIRKALPDADEIRVVAPATGVSFLDWLTNDEDEARREAHEAADRVAAATVDDAKVEIDRTGENTDVAESIRDALRNFPADEIVILTRPGEKATWLEDETLQTALETSGIPVRHLELTSA